MASSDYPWLQLPTWTQWEEQAFDSIYNSQGSSLSKTPYDNGLFTETLNAPLDTALPPPNNPLNPQNSSYRQRRAANSPRSESSTTGSTSQDNSRGHISVYPTSLPPIPPCIHTKPPQQRRKSQNRASQRAFRQRRTERFQALQSRVLNLEKQLDAAKVVNRLLAQMNGLRSLEELRERMGDGGGRRGREGDAAKGEEAREPPA
ncbi:hypothetical protein V500_04342, partial [Pseudogymnoascus sp. VKM F-4518 (FW-2643)]